VSNSSVDTKAQALKGKGDAPEHAAAQVSNRELLKWMFQFLKPVKALAFVACFYLAIGVAIEVIIPRQLGQTIDAIQKLNAEHVQYDPGFWAWLVGTEGKAGEIRTDVLVLLGLVTAGAFVSYLRNVSSMRFSMDMVYYIREAVYDKLQRVGFSFHDSISSGQLINRALSDLQNVRTFLQSSILSVLEIVLIVGGFVILLLTRQPWVALIALVPLPIWTWYIIRFSKRVQPKAKAVMEAGDRNVQIITENIAGVHVVKAFATEAGEIGKYSKNSVELFGKIRERIRLFANFHPMIRSIAIATQLGLMLATAMMIIHGKMTLGDLLVVSWSMGAILGRLQNVAALNNQYQDAIVSARRLHEVLMAPPVVKELPDAPALPSGSGGVSFENVTFGYDAEKPVLHDISFAVSPGTMVAIVGPTGAGKSTLVGLLARFYDPQQGRICIDDADIRQVSMESLRTQIAYVFQETFLFSNTVERNIAYGNPRASAGEIEMAARLAQAHEFIEELPKKYETILAERGSSLSGGQRQRLAIARAILQNPRILILDDATAAVDSETEELIRKGMKFAMQSRTTFVIAHRLSTVQAADLVLVLEEGRITQRGTHAELLSQEGHYREIAAAQLCGDEDTRRAESPSHMKRVLSPKTFAAATTRLEPNGRSEEAVQ
jgi:ATP-binding cassette, subfamily B, multidrug efflux pump